MPLTQNIIRGTIKVEKKREMDQDRILMHF